MGLNLANENHLLVVVDVFNGLEDAELVALLAAGSDQCLDILWEARPTVANAGVDELRANSGVAADAFADLVDIGPHDFAEIGDVVHEGNFRRQHGIGRILGHLGGGNVHEEHGVTVQRKGFVESGQHFLSAIGFNSANDAIRLHEVIDGRTFLQELGIGGHVERELASACLERCFERVADFFRRAYRNGGLRDDHEVITHVRADLLSYCQDVLQVRASIFSWGCAHRNKGRFGTLNSLL